MKKSKVLEIVQETIQNVLAEGPLHEFAKIKDDLKTAIEKVIADNPDLEGLDLKKAIKADATVEDALMGDTIYDNQLNKFIALSRGERTVGKRGRKVDPNKPAAAPKAKKAKTASADDSSTVASKLDKSITTAKGQDVTKKDVKTAIGKTYGKDNDIEGDQLGKLQAQEKKKMTRKFIDGMKAADIISPNNKIVDKTKYDIEWAKAKEEIAAKVATIK